MLFLIPLATGPELFWFQLQMFSYPFILNNVALQLTHKDQEVSLPVAVPEGPPVLLLMISTVV